MHEFAITKSMLDLVIEQAEKAGSKRVGKINLVIGKMSGVVDECVQFYFEFMSKSTVAEGAQLSFKIVPMTARCRRCGKQFEVQEFDWSCPDCKSASFEIVAGNELFVESIEVE